MALKDIKCDFDSDDLELEPPELPAKCLAGTEPPLCLCDFPGPKYKPIDSLGSTITHPPSPCGTQVNFEGAYFPLPQWFGFPPAVYQFAAAGEKSVSVPSTIICEERFYQRTVAIVKPEYMKYKDVVLRAVYQAGFSITSSRVVHLTPEQVAELYNYKYGCPMFPNLVMSVSMGPMLVLTLADMNAVEKWKYVVGPQSAIKEEWFYPFSARTRFNIHVDIPYSLHASRSLHHADKDNRFFRPQAVLEPIVDEEDRVKDYCSLYLTPTLVNGLVELCKVKPLDPVVYLAEWLLLNNPFQPKLPYHAALAPT